MEKRKIDTKRIVGMAMFSALAYATTFIFHIKVQFLTFDAKDAILTIASFIYGPLSALIMSLIPALIEFITISDTGFWGLIMNFASSAIFTVTASFIYKYKRSLNGAIIGLYSAVILTAGLMIPLNILITPIYMKVPTDTVIKFIPTLLFPFNLAKALMNAAIVMFLYKPVSVALKRARLIEGSIDERFNKQSVIMLTVGALTLAVAIILFVILR